MILAAAYREPIDHFAAAFEAADIQLEAIDVEAFALLRAVAPSSPRMASGPRSSRWPSATIARRLRSPTARSATSPACSSGAAAGSTLQSPASSASRPKRRAEIKLGLSLNDDDPANARARNAVKHELTTLARELVASLQFYQAQPDSLALSEILVTGGTTRMPGFVEELERLVRARVRPADPLGAVQADANVSARNDLASLAIAIGLGVDR